MCSSVDIHLPFSWINSLYGKWKDSLIPSHWPVLLILPRRQPSPLNTHSVDALWEASYKQHNNIIKGNAYCFVYLVFIDF